MIRTVPFAIIGAGPAGLAAAVAYGNGAVILERNPIAGKKLLLSGSGQCNFTNNLSNEDFIRACRKAGPFLKPAIYKADSACFIKLLTKAGCPAFAREDGKVFPVSLQASDVRNALLKACLDAGAEVLYNTKVQAVVKEEKGFLIRTDRTDLRCHKLLLATGGSSWSLTGSTGDGYAFAQALGHKLHPIKPALASVEVESYAFFKQCAGNTLYQVKAEFITKTAKHKDKGDLLFTHTGLSGPLILNNSYLLEKGDIIRLHLLPNADEAVVKALQTEPHKQVTNALKALNIPHALLEAILIKSGINPTAPASTLPQRQINNIIGALQAFDFTVKKLESLETSMSTAGGVLLKEVDAATMQSRIVKGLFLAGEVLDYALPTGGFNIQTAFSTGWLAGKSAK
jgi:predicted Rossmann fold flavoprotein